MPAFISAVNGVPGRPYATGLIQRPRPTPTPTPASQDQVQLTNKGTSDASPGLNLRRAATLRAQQALNVQPTTQSQAQPTPQAAASPSNVSHANTAKPLATGDVDGDGRVSGRDAKALFRYLFKGGPKPEGVEVADVNGDGKVSLIDALKILEQVIAPNLESDD